MLGALSTEEADYLSISAEGRQFLPSLSDEKPGTDYSMECYIDCYKIKI